MKKILRYLSLVLCIYFAIIQNTYAQRDYVPLPLDIDNAAWTELNGMVDTGPVDWTVLLKPETDTSLFNKTYKNIYAYTLSYPNQQEIKYCYASIRQEGKKAYIVRHYIEHYGWEEQAPQLLFDFDAQVGDTLCLGAYVYNAHEPKDSLYVVDSIGSIEMADGTLRTVQYLSNCGSDIMNSPLTIIEGVGETKHPFGFTSDYRAVKDESLIHNPLALICLSVDDSEVYQANNINPEWCGELLMYLGIEELEHTPKLKISPNPIHTFCHVQLYSASAAPKYLKIYNLLGVKVYQHCFNQNNIQLNLEHLPTGHYLVQVQDDKQIETSKIIVSH